MKHVKRCVLFMWRIPLAVIVYTALLVLCACIFLAFLDLRYAVKTWRSVA